MPVLQGITTVGEWMFDLCTLEESKYKKERTCEWQQIKADSCEIVFEHRNKEMWSYEDYCGIHNGSYSVSCE